MENANVKSKRNDYRVTSPVLLYQLADAGLLHQHLCGVGRVKEGSKIYYFERHNDVKAIIDAFNPNDWANNYTQEDFMLWQ